MLKASVNLLPLQTFDVPLRTVWFFSEYKQQNSQMTFFQKLLQKRIFLDEKKKLQTAYIIGLCVGPTLLAKLILDVAFLLVSLLLLSMWSSLMVPFKNEKEK